MRIQDRWLFRMGVLSELVARAPTKLGRTTLMKLAFLLQTVRGVPLGYDFRLYTYGPYDADVLNDLGLAESMKTIESTLIHFNGGYRYEYQTGPEYKQARGLFGADLEHYQEEIDWAITVFGNHSAAELELLSTIVHADRDYKKRSRQVALDDLCHLIREIKPHFSEVEVKRAIQELSGKGLLQSLQNESALTPSTENTERNAYPQ